MVSILPVLAQNPVEKYTYNMTFDNDGLTNVEVLYDSGFIGSGASWIAVPKTSFAETGVMPLTGTIISTRRLAYLSTVEGSANPFYDNLTFSYTSSKESFSMRLSFNLTDMAMIVEPNGFFYSPLIGVPSSAAVQAKLTFPDGVDALDEIQPTPVRVDTSGPTVDILFNLSSESRIAVTFRVSWALQTNHIQEGKVEADVPSRYLNLGTRMLELYNKAISLMDSLFNSTLDKISVKFFIPSSLPDISIGGYTPIDPSSFQTGAIYLNLFYFRAEPGTMETIALHELTHQYESHIGISPELLWVQEGLANYVAVQMGKPLGYDVTSTDADLETAASKLSGNFGMIQYWRPGVTTDSLFQYYAASYEVFKTLGGKYGGLSLYSRFFRDLRDLKGGLVSTNVAVLELGLAAGTDLSSQFTSWGFEFVDLSSLSARIVKLRAEAELYGPLLPFREQALSHLQQAQDSIQSSPEIAAAHITIAAFYIETVPMIIAAVALVLVLLVAAVVVAGRRGERKRAELGDHARD
jgi:hypothetical protein